MKDYILSFCNTFEYPKEAITEFLRTYECIRKNEQANTLFCENITSFNKGLFTEHSSELILLDTISKLVEIHPYTIHLLFFICLSKDTKKIYDNRKISYNVFYNSMLDLKWKLFECYKMHKIWGSCVAFWFKGFFECTRFALGRLQFEIIAFDRTYTGHNFTLNKGDTVLNVHIPSSGPLLHQDCLDSYRLAADFFKLDFVGRPTIFVCDSWLLFPKHTIFLPPSSNILAFINDYTILSEQTDEKYHDLWRIFYKEYNGSIHDFPSDTSLQRAYIDWISKGNPVGSGFGVFFWNESRI